MYIPTKSHPLSSIKLWFHKIGNKNNEILFALPSVVHPGYMLDSNVLAYLEQLLSGNVPIQSQLYSQLLKLCFLISKPDNVVFPTLAFWELSRNEINLPFSQATINKDRLIALVKVVLKSQALHESSIIENKVQFDDDKLYTLIKRYRADNIDEAANNFLRDLHFFEMTEAIGPNFDLKINVNAEYLKLCYEAHIDVAKKRSPESKVKLFIEHLSKRQLPFVAKAFNFCLRTLSDSLSNGDLLFKYGKINAYKAISSDQLMNTAVDLVISDFAYLIHGYVVDQIAYDIRFVTADRISFIVEDEISTCMAFLDKGLPQRFDVKPEFNYLSKKDKVLVEEFLSRRSTNFDFF